MSVIVEYFVDGNADHWLGGFQYLLPVPPTIGDEFLIEGEPNPFVVRSVSWVLSEEADFTHILVVLTPGDTK